MAKLTDRVIARIQELAKKGIPASKIAESLDVSKKAAYKYAKLQTAAPKSEPKAAPKVEAPTADSPEAVREVEAPKEPKPSKVYAVLFGSHVTREAIERVAATLEPRKVRKYAVEVGGKLFPVCQIVAAASQIPADKAKFFTSADATRVLTQLQFAVVTTPTGS